MSYGCQAEPVADVTKPIDEPLRVTHFLAELDVVIEQIISRPRIPAEACCDIELRDALAETRRINRLDGRDVDHLIHEIDH